MVRCHAVIGSCCSEAYLVPTTRALSLVGTGEDVVTYVLRRAARPEPGAVVCRVAPSFTFGFEILAARDDMRCGQR